MESEGQAYISLVILDLTLPDNANITAVFPIETNSEREPIYLSLQYVLIQCVFYGPQIVSSIGSIHVLT
jgi:hypothetical protein